MIGQKHGDGQTARGQREGRDGAGDREMTRGAAGRRIDRQSGPCAAVDDPLSRLLSAGGRVQLSTLQP